MISRHSATTASASSVACDIGHINDTTLSSLSAAHTFQNFSDVRFHSNSAMCASTGAQHLLPWQQCSDASFGSNSTTCKRFHSKSATRASATTERRAFLQQLSDSQRNFGFSFSAVSASLQHGISISFSFSINFSTTSASASVRVLLQPQCISASASARHQWQCSLCAAPVFQASSVDRNKLRQHQLR